jgi:adenylate cyclase
MTFEEAGSTYSDEFVQSILAESSTGGAPAVKPVLPSLQIDDSSDPQNESGSRVEFVEVDSRSMPPGIQTTMILDTLGSAFGETDSSIQRRRKGETVAQAKLRIIQQVSEKLVHIFEPQKLMGEIMSIVINQTDADRGLLCLLDDERRPVPIAARGLDENSEVLISRTVLTHVLEERKGVIVNPTGIASLTDVASTLCVPLWTGDTIIGLLSLDSVNPARTFTPEDLELLLPVAHQAAIGIQRGRLSQQVEAERRMRDHLSKYLDHRIVSQISTRGAASLEPAEKVVTVLFSDIVAFTKISEKLGPADVASFLGGYLTAMTEIIFKHGGTIDKYIGDAVMALFGAPVDSEDSASSAVRAALEMKDRLGDFRLPGRQSGSLRVRIGINTGLVVVGNLGSERRVEYTALGDAVNVASRLEAFARPNEICIAEDTYSKTGGGFSVEEIGTIDVKNRAEPVIVYKVLGEK